MYNFLTLGNDCSPAAALRNLNLREFALPFDWVVSTPELLDKCFNDNFSKFHTNIKLNNTKNRIIDEYGFEFPHDYPLNNSTPLNNIGEGVIGEENGKTIIDDYIKYYDIVKQKYDRRIIRFLNIVNDNKPIIILCRYNNIDVVNLYNIFLKYYNKNDIYIINSSNEQIEHSNIKNYYTESRGIWNDTSIWKEAVDSILCS